MAREKELTVNLVNRNYPPSPGVTGESAAELAEFLVSKGIRVNVISVKSQYFGGAETKDAVGVLYQVRTFYHGKNKIIRLLANIYEGFRLILKALFLKANVTICMTDPPLLNFWAALLLTGRRKWILWSMDLYPEAFLAGQLISHSNFFYKIVNRVVAKRSPDHLIGLGPLQVEYLEEKFSRAITYTILPCGIYSFVKAESTADKPDWAGSNKIVFGYCGNLGEAHSSEFVRSVIDHLIPQKNHLILSVYGAQAPDLVAYAQNKPGVTIVPQVKRFQLGLIDIHLSSLNPDWVNVCVPSKTVSSVCAGSTFLYCGRKDSDNWLLLQDAGWIISNENIDQDVQTFLNNISVTDVTKKKQKANALAEQLLGLKKMAFEGILEKIKILSVH